MLRLKIRYAVIIAVCVVAVIVTAVLYGMFASEHIFNESAQHLTEIYGQVNETFSQAIENDRKLMRSWRKYINNSVDIINGTDSDDAAKRQVELETFLENQREAWGFTNFYFINGERKSADPDDDSEYLNIVECTGVDGRPSTFRIRRSLHDLLDADKGGVVGVRENDDDNNIGRFMFLAVRTDVKTYKGREYSAIGLS